MCHSIISYFFTSRWDSAKPLSRCRTNYMTTTTGNEQTWLLVAENKTCNWLIVYNLFKYKKNWQRFPDTKISYYPNWIALHLFKQIQCMNENHTFISLFINISEKILHLTILSSVRTFVFNEYKFLLYNKYRKITLCVTPLPTLRIIYSIG